MTAECRSTGRVLTGRRYQVHWIAAAAARPCRKPRRYPTVPRLVVPGGTKPALHQRRRPGNSIQGLPGLHLRCATARRSMRGATEEHGSPKEREAPASSPLKNDGWPAATDDSAQKMSGAKPPVAMFQHADRPRSSQKTRRPSSIGASRALPADLPLCEPGRDDPSRNSTVSAADRQQSTRFRPGGAYSIGIGQPDKAYCAGRVCKFVTCRAG